MANLNLATIDVNDDKPNPFLSLKKFINSLLCYFDRHRAIQNREAIVKYAIELLDRGNEIVLSCRTLGHWKTAERFLTLIELTLEKELHYFENHEIPEVMDAKHKLDLNFKQLHPNMNYVY